jgi:hypothetical protein
MLHEYILYTGLSMKEEVLSKCGVEARGNLYFPRG